MTTTYFVKFMKQTDYSCS